MTNSERINAAIRSCLESCYESQVPLACLAEYVANLRADPLWRDADVHEVEVTVRQLLKQIVNSQGDTMSHPGCDMSHPG